MSQFISGIALLVRDYGEALAYYTQSLGFTLVEDRTDGARRWVVVMPPGAHETRIRLVKATKPEQIERVGDHTGGRVFLFLQTDDLMRDYAALKARGVHFIEKPRREVFGLGAIFTDLYGNRWELVEMAKPS
ncbi:MAG: VOC family protein [Rhodospirillaceae bacterium]|nr:VOC family protein [Rhodospirillaceae bacterium]